MSDRVGPPPRPVGRPHPVGTKPLDDLDPTGTVEVGGKKRNVVQLGPSELPPPGYSRDEELKRREDALTERLAKIEEALGLDNSAGPPVELSKLAISNEIASKYDMLRVTNAQDDFAYYWANFAAAHGIDVTAHQVMGYEVVRGDMPEAEACRDELGRRKIGDVILMRTPLDNYLSLQQLDRQKREMRENSVTASFQAMGDRWARRGVRPIVGLSEFQMQRALQRAQAQQIARQQFNNMVRDGRVAGLPPGR